MEKRPNNKQVTERYDVEFDDRYYRIVIGIACLVSLIVAFMMMAAGAVGLIWLIKLVFGC